MPSFKNTFIAVTVAVITTCSALSDYSVEPTSVPKSLRSHWCSDQRRACPLICEHVDSGQPMVNECNSDELNYGCICADGSKPNLTEYSMTLPYHVCTEWGNQCVADCDTSQCASQCREDNPCGAQDPERVTSSITEEPTASKTGDSDSSRQTGLGGFADGTGGNDDDSGAATVGMSRVVGAVLAGSLFGGFAFML